MHAAAAAAPAADRPAPARPPARPPSPAFPPNDEPRPPAPAPATSSRRRSLLLAGLAAGLLLVLALGAFLLLRDDGRGDDGRGDEVARRGSDGPAATTTPEARDRGDRDAEARSTGPEETAPPGSGGGDGGGDAPSGGGQGEAGRVTVNGVVELSLPAPAEPSTSPCAAIADGYRVRVLDDAGETSAVTPLVEGREVDGGTGRLGCRFEYWVRIPDRPPEHTFELVRGRPGGGQVGDGKVEVLTARVVESGLITDGSGPDLAYDEAG